MKSQPVALLVALILAAGPALAQSKDQLRQEVLRLSGFHQRYEYYVLSCAAAYNAVRQAKEAARALNPRDESPGVAEKPLSGSCQIPTETEVLTELAAQIGADVNDEELHQMQAFLSTGAGRRFLELQTASANAGLGVYLRLQRQPRQAPPASQK